MRSERWRLLGGNLLTSLSIALGVSPYKGARHSKEMLAAATPLPAYVTKFQSVFVKEDFDILPEHCKWDHAIELIPGAKPKSSKVYPLFPLEQEELDAFLEENLHTGRIRLLSQSLDNLGTTLGECLGRTRWSFPLDSTTYLYYFYKWLYTTSPRSHILLECSTII